MLTDHIEARIRADIEGTAPPAHHDAADRAAEAQMSAAQLADVDEYYRMELVDETGSFRPLTTVERRIAKRRATFRAYRLSEDGTSLAELDALSTSIQQQRVEVRDMSRRIEAIGRRPAPERRQLSEGELDAMHADMVGTTTATTGSATTSPSPARAALSENALDSMYADMAGDLRSALMSEI